MSLNLLVVGELFHNFPWRTNGRASKSDKRLIGAWRGRGGRERRKETGKKEEGKGWKGKEEEEEEEGTVRR